MAIGLFTCLDSRVKLVSWILYNRIWSLRAVTVFESSLAMRCTIFCDQYFSVSRCRSSYGHSDHGVLSPNSGANFSFSLFSRSHKYPSVSVLLFFHFVFRLPGCLPSAAFDVRCRSTEADKSVSNTNFTEGKRGGTALNNP